MIPHPPSLSYLFPLVHQYLTKPSSTFRCSPPPSLSVPAALLVGDVGGRLLVAADGVWEGHPEATHWPQPLFQLRDLSGGVKRDCFWWLRDALKEEEDEKRMEEEKSALVWCGWLGGSILKPLTKVSGWKRDTTGLCWAAFYQKKKKKVPRMPSR